MRSMLRKSVSRQLLAITFERLALNIIGSIIV